LSRYPTYAGVGKLVAQGDRGPQPFVGVCGRHADVDDGHVGTVLGDRSGERAAVGHRGHDRVAAIFQQP
jgi:hypothetical protein